ncbi:MAG: hypothetical protein A2992_03295 [Elusimicrobia bacterium RIFCSPLOWO2_01_FULL_59_12]|nr:MAG: hypothetical protein A2992_03295 [Elusimicrobia bacterium RIFCSPLOWO2_01_FULL_59_12]
MTTRVVCLITALCFLLSDFSLAAPPPLPTFPPLTFHPPRPERVVLPNGLVVFLLEDHELPLFRVQVLVRAGSQDDPAGRTGLGSIFGPAMTQGGSARYSPEQILRVLDTTGGGLAFSVGTEETAGSLSGRSADFDTLFSLFTDLLLFPQFRNDFVKLEKDKVQEDLRRMNDEPSDIARREFRKAVYGKTHPYARTPDPQTIDRIRRKDLLEMHRLYFKPNAAMLAVSGDFKSAEVKRKIAEALGPWASGVVTHPPVPPVVPTAAGALYYVQRPLDQSQIRIGHTGFARHDPDHFAWEIFNELWGGSATSRLFRIVRTEKGLAYAVASVFTEPKDLGMIVAVSQTRGPETPLAIQSILEINRAVREAPFSEEEVRAAREAIQNRFIENFTSSEQIAGERMSLEFQGFPSGYLDTYTENIGRVRLADLKRAARKHLHPDRSVILVVGDLSTFNKPLSTIGRPQEIRPPDYRLEAQRP